MVSGNRHWSQNRSSITSDDGNTKRKQRRALPALFEPFWAIDARIVVAEENARRWFHFDQWHIGSSFEPSRSIEFLFSHSLPRISRSLRLYSFIFWMRKKGDKERDDPEGALGEILFPFFWVNPFPDRNTNRQILR